MLIKIYIASFSRFSSLVCKLRMWLSLSLVLSFLFIVCITIRERLPSRMSSPIPRSFAYCSLMTAMISSYIWKAAPNVSMYFITAYLYRGFKSTKLAIKRRHSLGRTEVLFNTIWIYWSSVGTRVPWCQLISQFCPICKFTISSL